MEQLLVLVFAVIVFARSGIAFNPPFIPLGWTTVYPCAVDVPSRVLANVVTTQYTDNTPASHRALRRRELHVRRGRVQQRVPLRHWPSWNAESRAHDGL